MGDKRQIEKGRFFIYYSFDEKILNGNKLNIKELTRYNKEWAEFLCKCGWRIITVLMILFMIEWLIQHLKYYRIISNVIILGR